jgi:hypothetical protein
MTKKNIRTQSQVLSEVLVNLSSGFFGYLLLSTFSSLTSEILTKNLIFGFAFYYLAVKIRNNINI